MEPGGLGVWDEHFQGLIKQNAVFAGCILGTVPWVLRILSCIGHLVFLQEQSERLELKKKLKQNLAEEAPNVNLKISLTHP